MTQPPINTAPVVAPVDPFAVLPQGISPDWAEERRLRAAGGVGGRAVMA